MSETKYISFDPWWGGFNNVRMSYETAAAIAHVTGRTLILPPKVYILFLAQHQKKDSFFDIWKIFDKAAFTRTFKTIEYHNVPEYQQFNSDIQYFDGIKDAPFVRNILFDDVMKDWGPQRNPDSHVLFHNITDRDWFHKFSRGRKKIDLDTDYKFIHFPRNLLSHFYYHVYTEDMKGLASAVQSGIQFKPEYEGMASCIMQGEYNALHIRRGDFLNVRKEVTNDMYKNLESLIEGRVEKDLPLYIATDEKNLSIFDFLKTKYDIKFLSDFIGAESYTALSLDTIICANAKTFLGSHLSTFSDYIHIQRKYRGKKDFSRHNINYKRNEINYNELPWEQERYTWDNLWVNLY